MKCHLLEVAGRYGGTPASEDCLIPTPVEVDICDIRRSECNDIQTQIGLSPVPEKCNQCDVSYSIVKPDFTVTISYQCSTSIDSFLV